jgi:hypothetical protein
VTLRLIFSSAACIALLAASCSRTLAAPPLSPVPPPSPSAHAQDATFDQYRQHLQALIAVVQACSKVRDIKTCDPSQVGLDDSLTITSAAGSSHRLIRYGWLRVLLSQAQDKDPAPEKPDTSAAAKEQSAIESVRPPKPATTQLLKDAQTRLTQDIAQSDAVQATLPNHDRERAAMKQVLAEREFRNLEEPTARDSALEKIGNWLNRFFENAAALSGRFVWLGRVVVWGFISIVCVGLVWGLIQLERRWRIRLVPDTQMPAPGAASARHWQLWLEDARRAAAAGLWREAIHFLYWASISRLESRRLWPTDRARTPREYLALVPVHDPRQPSLATLTGSFERVWYGGRPASEPDYRRAEQIAIALIEGSVAQKPAAAATASAGGPAQ